MTVYNLGSINIDYFYTVPHLPIGGETLSALSFRRGLGGKGTNQSVAAAQAGSEVFHIGSVGVDAEWVLKRMADFGVDVFHVLESKLETGHAVIYVDDGGENSIVLSRGANYDQDPNHISDSLLGAEPGDTLLLQNETSHQVEAAKIGKDMGLRVVYSAAPFDLVQVQAILPYVTLLVMNEVEAAQLCAAMKTTLDKIDVPEILVTRGGKGARWQSQTGERHEIAALNVKVVDTTGAGDTFLGYFAAMRDMGQDVRAALGIATAAAALKVTRHGTADAIPNMRDVEAFLEARAAQAD